MVRFSFKTLLIVSLTSASAHALTQAEKQYLMQLHGGRQPASGSSVSAPSTPSSRRVPPSQAQQSQQLQQILAQQQRLEAQVAQERKRLAQERAAERQSALQAAQQLVAKNKALDDQIKAAGQRAHLTQQQQRALDADLTKRERDLAQREQKFKDAVSRQSEDLSKQASTYTALGKKLAETRKQERADLEAGKVALALAEARAADAIEQKEAALTAQEKKHQEQIDKIVMENAENIRQKEQDYVDLQQKYGKYSDDLKKSLQSAEQKSKALEDRLKADNLKGSNEAAAIKQKEADLDKRSALLEQRWKKLDDASNTHLQSHLRATQELAAEKQKLEAQANDLKKREQDAIDTMKAALHKNNLTKIEREHIEEQKRQLAEDAQNYDLISEQIKTLKATSQGYEQSVKELKEKLYQQSAKLNRQLAETKTELAETKTRLEEANRQLAEEQRQRDDFRNRKEKLRLDDAKDKAQREAAAAAQRDAAAAAQREAAAAEAQREAAAAEAQREAAAAAQREAAAAAQREAEAQAIVAAGGHPKTTYWVNNPGHVKKTLSSEDMYKIAKDAANQLPHRLEFVLRKQYMEGFVGGMTKNKAHRPTIRGDLQKYYDEGFLAGQKEAEDRGL